MARLFDQEHKVSIDTKGFCLDNYYNKKRFSCKNNLYNPFGKWDIKVEYGLNY